MTGKTCDKEFGAIYQAEYVSPKVEISRRWNKQRKDRGPLAEEAAKRKKATLKQGDKSPDTPKSGEGFGESAEQAAKLLGVGKTAVEEMAAIQEDQPDLAEKLATGKATVKQERRKAKERKRQTSWCRYALQISSILCANNAKASCKVTRLAFAKDRAIFKTGTRDSYS